MVKMSEYYTHFGNLEDLKMEILKIHKNLSWISYQCYFTAFGGLYSRGCPLYVANEDLSRLESHLKHDSISHSAFIGANEFVRKSGQSFIEP